MSACDVCLSDACSWRTLVLYSNVMQFTRCTGGCVSSRRLWLLAAVDVRLNLCKSRSHSCHPLQHAYSSSACHASATSTHAFLARTRAGLRTHCTPRAPPRRQPLAITPSGLPAASRLCGALHAVRCPPTPAETGHAPEHPPCRHARGLRRPPRPRPLARLSGAAITASRALNRPGTYQAHGRLPSST